MLSRKRTVLRKLLLNSMRSTVGFDNHWKSTVGTGSGWSVRNFRVAVVGAAGGIGQPLSLLLKLNPLVTQLVLHDLDDTAGIASDISHICTQSRVSSFQGKDQKPMVEALKDADVVVVSAGLPRKPGMTRADLIGANAKVALGVAEAISKSCPKAFLAMITNPVNSIVPVVAEILKSKGKFDPKRIFGVTTLDTVRAKAFLGEAMNVDPACVEIPVIGGHSGITILPLISQCQPKFTGGAEELQCLTTRIQEAGTEVVKAKAGKGSATLSMAYAAALFTNALLRARNNESGVIESAYVLSDVTDVKYFASPLELGPDGVIKILKLPKLSEGEQKALEKMKAELCENIDIGEKYAKEAIAKSKC